MRVSKQAQHPRDDHRERHVSGGFTMVQRVAAADPEPSGIQPQVNILVGDVRARLRDLPDEFVHCVVTSPPYWGLRDYGVEPQIWGGDLACDHQWDSLRSFTRNGQTGGTSSPKVAIKGKDNFQTFAPTTSHFCAKCNAWRGSLGLEPTLELYVEHIVEVFREVRRVLRNDGILWLNIGDSYSRAGETNVPQTKNAPVAYPNHAKDGSSDGVTGRGARPGSRQRGPKPKDLMLVPFEVARALRNDGWYLRSDVIWYRPNQMPESIQDRPTSSYEHIFMFAKSRAYYFDQEAVRRDPAPSNNGTCNAPPLDGYTGGRMLDGNRTKSTRRKYEQIIGGNIRNVWLINTEPFALAHFATFPTKLAETCIKAGTSDKGCCSKCGAPYIRKVSKPDFTDAPKRNSDRWDQVKVADRQGHGGRTSAGQAWQDWRLANPNIHLGWEASCKCDAPIALCTVLDPFGGSGTVGVVANELRRNALLAELNPTYAKMAEDRIAGFFVDVQRI